MAKPAEVARTIRLFVDQALSPEALSRNLAVVAREARDDLIRKEEAPPQYRTFVDGREGAAEETVRPDGAIIYRFNVLGLAVRLAMEGLIAGSTVQTGTFRRYWTIGVGGRLWRGSIESIPGDAEVTLVNPLPYARKREAEAPLIERVRQRVRRQWPSVSVERTYVVLTSEFKVGPFEVPYILRGHQRSFAQKYASHIEVNGGRSVVTNRKDLRKGEQLTYPALVLVAGRS